MFVVSIEHQRNGVGEQLLGLIESANGLANVPYDSVQTWQQGGITLVHQARWVTKEDRFTTSLTEECSSGIQIVGWVRLYNRDDLQASLGNGIASMSDVDVIKQAYIKWGREFFSHLVGDFSFVIFDQNNNNFVVVRDQIGVRPLYYYKDNKCIIFASSIAILTSLKDLKLSYSQEWLARHIACCSADLTLTPYSEIKKVPPGHFVEVDDRKHTVFKYYDLGDDKSLTDSHNYVDVYRALLKESVLSRTKTDFPVAAENSGGLDSATIVKLAAQNTDKAEDDLACYGFALNAIEVSRAFEVTSSSRAAFLHLFDFKNCYTPEKRRKYGYKFTTASGVPYTHADAVSYGPLFDAVEKSEARVILSGFGGDQFVTHFGDQVLDELFTRGEYRLWFNRAPGGYLNITTLFLKKLYRRYTNRRSAGSQRLKDNVNQRWAHNILKRDKMDEFDVKAVFTKKNDQYQSYSTFNDYLLGTNWDAGHIARLEDCSLAAAAFGLEYRWPLLDIRLICFYLSTPCEQRLGTGMKRRYLHRRAMAGLLPEGIEDKQYGGKPFNNNAVEVFDFATLYDFDNLEPELKELIDESLLMKSLQMYELNADTNGNKAWLTRLLLLNNWLKAD